MSIKIETLEQLQELLCDDSIDDDWRLIHIDVECFDNNREITITVDKINCQLYKEIKESLRFIN